MTNPDPVLTFNVYCNKRIDAVVYGAVAPFLGRLRADSAGERWSLWMVRYPRRGEHLKLRLHGPTEDSSRVGDLLTEAVDALFASLPPAPAEEERFSRPRVPPIDSEDAGEDDAPDRSLLRTQYLRSHINLGPRVFLDDDEYVARVVDGLARGAELALHGLRPADDGTVPGPARQRALLKALVAGLAGAGLSSGERACYLAYHRNWLLRFGLADEAQEAEMVARYDERLERMGPAKKQLRAAALAQWDDGAMPAAGPEAEWRGSIGRLADFASRFRGDPGYQLDPYSNDPCFPVIFKVFHGTANQIGLGLKEEVFVHHFLLRSVTAATEPEMQHGTL